jgi:tRNA threonylcarbamoyladenosine biosynthesis protein TsaE
VIGLAGPLGAGKTAFVKGLAEGLGIDPDQVASPTFVIASEYPASAGRRLVHVDFYRLASVAELDATGFRDLLGPDAIVAAEWADQLPEGLPDDRLDLRIERASAAPSERVLHASGSGPVSRAALDRWRQALGAEAE